MNKLCCLLKLNNEDELFEKITNSFRQTITTWDYFVNWDKVITNVRLFEKELNLLNYLIGKQNLREEAYSLFKEYPQVIKAIPTLLAVRGGSIEVLTDPKNFIYKKINFFNSYHELDDLKDYVDLIINSGLGDILADKKVKNLVDYAMGVEVGLDSNGRKNRTGTLMESIVKRFVNDTCNELQIEYLEQATSNKINKAWGINVEVDKSSRILDFAINNNGKLFFIECNFYGGGGSKLKSTATEYIEMNKYWNKQGIEFIWITDGAGWKSTLRPLREFFDKAEFLLNLDILKHGILKTILQ
jgi:type II restriction enzyme